MPGSLTPDGYKGSPYSQHPCSGPHENGVSPQEVIKRILEVWKAIHVRRGKVSSDEGCPLHSGDYFTVHHVWSVKARGTNVPYLQYLPRNQSYCALHREYVEKDFWTNRFRVRA